MWEASFLRLGWNIQFVFRSPAFFGASFLILYLSHSSLTLLPSSLSYLLVAPSLSVCNLALVGSCRLNCDPLMTLQLYPSAYTYPQLKMLVIVKDRKTAMCPRSAFVPWDTGIASRRFLKACGRQEHCDQQFQKSPATVPPCFFGL